MTKPTYVDPLPPAQATPAVTDAESLPDRGDVGVSGARARLGVRLFAERYALIGVWAGMAVVFAVLEPDYFLRGSTIQVVSATMAIYVLLGLGALIPAVVNELDLSTAFVMGLAATLVPTLVSLHGTSTLVAVIIALLASAACGLLNGFIVVKLGVDSMITTLGMGTALIGVAEGISHETSVSGLSESFGKIATTQILGLEAVVWYGIALAIFIAYLLAYTPLGRHMMFVGSNREVARLAGVRVERIRMGAYVVGGLIAGLAGVLLAAQLRGFQASSATGYLLPAVAALFMSSVVVRPGRFNPIGILIASGFLGTGTFGLQLLGYSGWASQLFYGATLVLSAAIVAIVRRHASTA